MIEWIFAVKFWKEKAIPAKARVRTAWRAEKIRREAAGEDTTDFSEAAFKREVYEAGMAHFEKLNYIRYENQPANQ